MTTLFHTLLLVYFGIANTFTTSISKNSNYYKNTTFGAAYYSSFADDPCRPDTKRSRGVVEQFISLSHHKGKRSATGTTHLDVSQINLLDEVQNAEACKYFDSRHEVAINAQRNNDENSPAFDVVYFKIGDFYFVVITPAPLSGPEVVQTGYAGLIIYDLGLNRIEGYSM